MKTVWLLERPEYVKDFAEAWIRLGYHTEIISEISMMQRLAAGDKPDMVITNKAMSTLGFEPPKDSFTVLSMCEERNVPFIYMQWDNVFYDPRMTTLEQQDKAVALGLPRIHPFVPPNADNLYVFTVSKEMLPFLKGKHVEKMDFGVNELRFMPSDAPKLYDVGFVGTSLIGDGNDGMSVMEQVGLVKDGNVHLDLGDEPTARSWELLCKVRQSAIDRITATVTSKAHVWGDGWDQVTGITKHGRVKHEDLPAVINQCKVNLNVSKACFPWDVAPRVLEILACEGAMLTTNTPGVWNQFKRVSQMFTDAEDLQGRLDFMLSDSCDRVRMGREGREIILSGWTWLHRAKRIQEVVFGA